MNAYQRRSGMNVAKNEGYSFFRAGAFGVVKIAKESVRILGISQQQAKETEQVYKTSEQKRNIVEA